MPRILGIDIPNDKKIRTALTYVYGIGQTTSDKLLAIFFFLSFTWKTKPRHKAISAKQLLSGHSESSLLISVD